MNASYHIEEVNIGSRKALHISLLTDSDYADALLDRGVFQFGDGYRLGLHHVSAKPHVKMTLTAMSPRGDTAVATADVNRETRASSAEGMERVSALLSRSHDATLFLRVLPSLIAANPRVAGCYADAAAVLLAGVGASFACSQPELGPMPCVLAVGALADQLVAVTEDCGGPYYEDTTGWG